MKVKTLALRGSVVNLFQGARYITFYNVTCEPAHLLINLVAHALDARERRKTASAFIGTAAVRFLPNVAWNAECSGTLAAAAAGAAAAATRTPRIPDG